jgi:hypothetical protein
MMYGYAAASLLFSAIGEAKPYIMYGSWIADVGQVVNLHGGWLPPLSRANTRGTLWVGSGCHA